jgi:hypothetical protein
MDPVELYGISKKINNIKKIINNTVLNLEDCDRRMKICKEEISEMIVEKNRMEERYIQKIKDYVSEEQIIYNLELVRSVNSSEYINEMPKVLRDMVELERGIKYKNYEILLLNDKKIEINKRMDRKMGVILPIMLLIILYGFFAVLYYIYVYIL